VSQATGIVPSVDADTTDLAGDVVPQEDDAKMDAANVVPAGSTTNRPHV